MKSYIEPVICQNEILRYAGCANKMDMAQAQISELLEDCLEEILPKLSYKLCYLELPLTITEEVCDFGCMQVASRDLAKNLKGCKRVLLFAATIGVEMDRQIARYGRLSPAKAVLLQAIGAERIEALCDAFCAEKEQELVMQNATLRPRFSPGYGDLPLETQTDIFQMLNCSKHIGLALNDSLLMAPSKSVTAFVGIEASTSGCKDKDAMKKKHDCKECNKTDCTFRISEMI